MAKQNFNPESLLLNDTPYIQAVPELSIQDIANTLKKPAENVESSSISKADAISKKSFILPQQKNEIRDITYDVPIESIYDRLSDGTYIAKFDNYKGAEGNEDRLAKQQSSWEQIWNGVSKNLAKVGTYALDATVGTVYGIYNGIEEGEWSAVWDNDFSRTLDDWNKRLDYALPNYYTDEQKSMNVLESLGTVNFWANDVTGGLAFVGGALLPEIALAGATGGGSLPSSAARLGFKTGLKKGAKTLGRTTIKTSADDIATAAKTLRREKAANLRRSYNRAKLGEIGGETLKTAGFLARTSNFEAGMEARHNYHDAIDSYYRDFERLNGRQPSLEEARDFMESAKTAANGVYATNMAILSVSNAAMFGKRFGIGINFGKQAKNAGNKFLGLGYNKLDDGTLAMQKASRAQKVGGNVYKILSKPAIEGLYEEGFQGVAGQTMQNYLRAQYDPEIEATYNLSSAINDAFSKQYGTNEGWKEMAIGFIIGFAGGGIQGQGFEGIGKNSWKAQYNNTEKAVEDFNKNYKARQEAIIKNMNNSNALANFVAGQNSNISDLGNTDLNTTLENKFFISSQEHMKPLSQIQADYDSVIDNYEFSASEIETLGGQEGVDLYKENLKLQFDNNLKDYRFARNTVRTLGLNQAIQEENTGNIFEVGEYLTTSIMLGRSSERTARQVASQIDELIGEQGSYDAMKFYNSLRGSKLEMAKNLKKKKKRLEVLEDRAKQYGRSLSGLSSDIKADFKNETLEKRYNKTAEQHFRTTQEAAKLREEIDSAEKALSNEFKASNYELREDVLDIDGLQNVNTYIEKLDAIEQYSKDLANNGRTQDAATLEYLIDQFKEHSDAFREMNNTVRKMADQSFFESEKGKNLVSSIIGPRYRMSEEFRNAIAENNEIIDNSLRRNGIRTEEGVSSILESVIQENPDLSEREKFRLESLIRMHLGYERLINNLEKQRSAEPNIDGQESNATTPLDGDTLSVRINLDSVDDSTTNLDSINETIDIMLAEVDKIRGKERVDKQSVKDRIKEIQNQTKRETLTDKMFKDFLEEDLGPAIIPQGVINDLAYKVKDREELTEKEMAVRKEMSADVENALQRIKSNEEIIKGLENELVSVMPKIINSEDYIRLEELNRKRVNETITSEELDELQQLEDDMDQWLYISGAIAEGQRLSDLLRLKAQLENTPIQDLQNVEDVSAQEKLNLSDFPDIRSSSKHYDKDLKYDAVVASMEKGKIKVSGISKQDLEELAGITFEVVEENRQGQIVITPETAEAINETNRVLILPASENLTTNYGVVQKVFQDGSTRPLNSSFKSDFNGSPMDPRASYNSSAGDEVKIEVDPQDPYNVELLDNYRNAQTDSEKEEAIRELKRGLVLRVVENIDGQDKFTGVLKSDREGKRINKAAKTFVSLRNQIIDNEEFLSQISTSSLRQEIPVDGRPTIKKIYLGHPNFLTVSNGDGTITIQNKQFTKQDAEKIVDIGYITRDSVKTRSGVSEGLDTTFLAKRDSNQKTPFVVFTVGNKKVAYPVTLNKIAKPDNQELNDIFYSDSSKENKIAALNDILASRGVDINKRGNMFNFDNVEDRNFFDQKLAQLENIDYFYDLEEWTKKRNSIEDILTEQARIDINLSDPLHSPKLSLDYTNMNIDVSKFEIREEVKNKAKKKTITKKPEGEQTKLDFENAEESREEDC